MSEKHTLGQWFADEARPTDWRVRADDGKGGFWEIAQMNGKATEDEANARLIAAAPDLLAALEALYDAVLADDAREAEGSGAIGIDGALMDQCAAALARVKA